MKIVSWNCGGKFREKFQDIIAVNAATNDKKYPESFTLRVCVID